MSNYKWMKTDTASIMFSSLSTKKWGRTFRMAAIFKDEDINPELLKKAAADIMPRYPSTHTTLKKGFFWNYQECTSLLPEIREEHSRALVPMSLRNDGRPDFRLLYYKRRLSLETAHYIGDGKGVTEYFNALLIRYAELCDNPDSEYVSTEPAQDEFDNAFATYFKKGGEKAPGDKIEAYHLPGKIEKDFLQIFYTLIPVEEICTKAKEKELTVTEYASAALILGSIRNAKEPITKPIVIAIPVNLRRFFPTNSIRNFTIQSKIEFYTEGRTDWTFDEICNKIKGQLKSRLTLDELQKILNRFGALVNNPILKIVPNVIKQPVLRKAQAKTHSCFTTILTNTGESELSPSLVPKIERVDGVNGDTSGYGLISTCSAVSVNGLFNLCFSVCSHDTSWVRECVRVLSQQGLNIRIESTYGNGEK